MIEASGQVWLCGMSRVRVSSVVAFRDRARLARLSLRNRLMRGATPEVETVTRRGESPGNTSVNERTARRTASRLSSGSPMPMKTTFVASSPDFAAASRATRNCRTISPAVRFRLKPMVAVAQNAQARVHPD